MKKFLNFLFPRKKEINVLRQRLELLEQKTDELSHYAERLFTEKHELIVEDRGKLEALDFYVQRLFTEKHELIMENRKKLEELDFYVQNLFTEKHELIMQDRKKLEELDSYVQRLFSEKHELIMQDRKKLEELDSYVQRLFSEKHEMILEVRKEILELVRQNILKFYADREECEKSEELEFLKKNPIQMYPYYWTDEYLNMEVQCLKDEEGYFYVMYKEKKLFFPLSYTKKQVEDYYRFLLLEQDKRSPHYYGLDKEWDKDSVFIDIGAAEGLISLEMVDKVNKVYMFESDTEWINALRKTFEPYSDKVEILNKYVTNCQSDREIALNNIIKEEQIYIIKIDVEGNEMKVLEGMRGMVLRKGSGIFICCYHHQEDEEEILNYFKRQSMEIEIASGYILSVWGGYKEPYFRRGICRAICNTEYLTIV